MAEEKICELNVLCASSMPCPVLYRKGDMPGRACYPMHSHEWGEFVYSFSGVLEITVNDRRYLVLPHYGIWVPSHVMHQCYSDKQAEHCSIYIESALCGTLSPEPCSVQITPLMRNMLEHLRHDSACDDDEQHTRFLRVFLDQLQASPCIGSYLPVPGDPVLAALLQELEENPADNRSVRELAQSLGITERTLARKCKKELKITLLEWRQRLRTIKALLMLEEGAHVEHIAFELGYSNASAFIVMFKKLMGKTPAEYRPS